MKETLGQRLQRLRAGLGLSQRQLAEAAGVPARSLQNWEVDYREPGWRALVRLAARLGVTVESLADTAPVDQGKRPARLPGPTRLPPGPKRKGKKK
jgi:transcriptional regulator with XRE-family HTH domain